MDLRGERRAARHRAVRRARGGRLKAGTAHRADRRRGHEHHALHVGNDRAPEGRAALASRRALRVPRAHRAKWRDVRRPHARRHAALSHDGRALDDRDGAAERRARVPAGLESRGGGPAHRGGANHIAVSRADALPRSGVAARSHAIRREQRDHARLRGRADGEHARARRRARVPAPQIPEPPRQHRGLHLHRVRSRAREADVRRPARGLRPRAHRPRRSRAPRKP